MADNISETEYVELCKDFPFFELVGHKGFGIKIWLIFRALNFGKVSIESVASNPCQSLMQNNIEFNQIKRFLEELNTNKILKKYGEEYSLFPEYSYELHRICFEAGKKLERHERDIKRFIQECGYTYDDRNRTLSQNFITGDVNAKTDTLKDLLSQLAFSGARLLVKIINNMD